jgi:hypothetical protein
MIEMHETLHNNVKGYIDANNVINNFTIIKGWCFHNINGVSKLRAVQGETIIEVSIQERSDVAEFYNRKDILHCGWKFKCQKNQLTYLQIYTDDAWNNVFSFLQSTSNESLINVIEEKTSELDNTIKLNMEIGINSGKVPSYIVVDNFYKNPDDVRNFALTQEYNYHKDYHKGKRTDTPFRFNGLKERFEQIVGTKIKNWEHYGTNGVFQICVAGDEIVYHTDFQQYAGVLFLTPNAPPETGTAIYRSKHTLKTKVDKTEEKLVFKNGYLDSTEFDVVDVVGNIYNRLVLFDAKQIHSATTYFGTNLENGRLFQLFFFDLDN